MANVEYTNIAFGGSEGVWMINGPPECTENTDFIGTKCKTMKTFAFSANGDVFAYCDGRRVSVVCTSTWKELFSVIRPRTFVMEFSPQSSMLALWQNYIITKDIPANSPNMQIYDVKSNQLVYEYVHKSHDTWNLQWLKDESLCARVVSNEIYFYENMDFTKLANKCRIEKLTSFKLGHSKANLLTYVPIIKAEPCDLKMLTYPNFTSPPITRKRFYKTDKVDILWNSKDSAVLVLSTLETSTESYYGEQSLYYMDIKGDTSRIVLDKNGPIYSMKWHPNSKEFIIVYGYMPSKVTLFNMKCDAIFDFGTGPRTTCEFNPQGNILCITGFGNLPGKMEFWDMEKKKHINTSTATNSTSFEWSRDGQHVLTATTAPRLRIDNGYKVWHYSGALVVEKLTDSDHELWMANWQPGPAGPVPVISSKLPVGFARPASDAKVTKAYVPPSARGRPASASIKAGYEPPSNLRGENAVKLSKTALKNKKKRENKAKTKEIEKTVDDNMEKPSTIVTALADEISTGNLETDKKIKNLKKKIDQIEKLKQKQKDGEKLELNQLEKIKKLDELTDNLSALKVQLQ